MNKLKSRYILILSFFLLFIVVGAASASSDDSIASDNVNDEILTLSDSVNEVDTVSSGTVDELGSAAGNSVLGDNPKSLSDLNNLIGNNTTVDLTDNYAFNEETDSAFIEGFVISTSDFTLNGNGYTIDTKGLVHRLFVFDNASNIVIKDINVINSGSIVYITNSNENINLSLMGTFISAGNAAYAVNTQNVGHVSLIGNFSNFVADGLGDGSVLVVRNFQNGITLKGNFTNNTASQYGGVAYIGWTGGTRWRYYF